MPTVVDELLIALNLDPSKFRVGADEAVRQTRKVHDETTKHWGNIRKLVGIDVSDAFTKVTGKIVGFFAALAGASTIVDFTAKVTQAGTALKIMSEALNMSPGRISQIEMAVGRIPAPTEGVLSSLMRLNDIRVAFQTYHGAFGTEPPTWVQMLGLNLDKIKNSEDFLEQISKALDKKGYDTQRKMWFFREMAGIDIGLATLYSRPGGVGRAQEEIRATEVDAWTQHQIEQANQLTSSWHHAQDALTAFGRSILEKLEPQLSAQLDHFSAQVENLNAGLRKLLGEEPIPGAKPFSQKQFQQMLREDIWGGPGLSEMLRGAPHNLNEIWGGPNLPDWLISGLERLGNWPGNMVSRETTGPGQVHEDWMAKYGRMGGVPISVMGRPITEGSPLPVKIIGPLQFPPPTTRTPPRHREEESSPVLLTQPARPFFPTPTPSATPLVRPNNVSRPTRPFVPTPTPSAPLQLPGAVPPTPRGAEESLMGLPGLAEGGSFTVGGREGRDANRVTLALTKGEHVTVLKPAEAKRRWDLLRAFLAQGRIDELALMAGRLATEPWGYGEGEPQRTQWSRINREMPHGNNLIPGIDRPLQPEWDIMQSSPWWRPGRPRWYPAWGPSHNQQDVNLQGGARIGASMQAASLPTRGNQSSTQVTIATLSVGSEHAGSGSNALMQRLKRDVFAMRSDVGLA